jgi:hypothetical protein
MSVADPPLSRFSSTDLTLRVHVETSGIGKINPSAMAGMGLHEPWPTLLEQSSIWTMTIALSLHHVEVQSRMFGGHCGRDEFLCSGHAIFR